MHIPINLLNGYKMLFYWLSFINHFLLYNYNTPSKLSLWSIKGINDKLDIVWIFIILSIYG